MAQQPDDLALGAGLIRKGEASGQSPVMAAATPSPVQPAPPPLAAPSPAAPPVPARQFVPPEEGRGVVPVPPTDEAKRFTSFRLPVALDEDLRAMVFQTRRSKQDILIEFVTEGVARWKRAMAKGG
jgi:hypothetical protein